MATPRFNKEQLEKFWQVYKQAGWNVTKAAMDAGEPYPTWQHRIRMCKSVGFREEGKRIEISRKLALPELESSLEMVKRCGSLNKAAQLMGLNRSTLQNRLARLKHQTGAEFVPADDHRILLLDIETAPNKAYFWGGTWKVNINPDWIEANGHVLCWTAKWLGDKEATFLRLKDRKHKSLLGPIHQMLNEADAVVHYNGQKFDIPTLNKEFLTHGFTPPAPYKQIDLLLTMREGFKFPSNKLDYSEKS